MWFLSGLKDHIRQMKKNFIKDGVVDLRSMLYSQYTDVKKKWIDLKEDTYRRYVRYIIKENDDDKKIKEKEENQKIEEEIKFVTTNTKLILPEYSNNFKRILVSGDWHTGHMTGLTSPDWWQSLDNPIFKEAAQMQRQGWEYFTTTVDHINREHKIDILIINGDAIDGNQKITAGSEAITTDRMNQVQIAKECIEYIGADRIYITPGSPYHVGKTEDWERVLAEQVGATFRDELRLKVNGKIIQARHKIGGTSIFHGKATQLIKQKLQDYLRNIYENSDEFADIIIRSHVHYFVEVKDKNFIGVITPSMQLKSKFGVRQCNTIIDYGLYVIDIYEDGRIVTTPYIADLNIMKNDLIIDED